MFYPYIDPHRCFFCSHTQDVVFTLPGALGGVLFVFAALFSFVAIPRAGLATAQAVWSLETNAMTNGRWAPEISLVAMKNMAQRDEIIYDNLPV